MKESAKWIIVVLLLAGIIVCAYFGYDFLTRNKTNNGLVVDSPSQDQTSTKNPAADFTVYDIDGNEVKLSDMKGKPVVINFWATWCPYCVKEMPDFQKAFNEYGDDVHFMMINVTDGYRETIASASAYITEEEYTFPVYYDTGLSAAITYSAYSLPCTFFIDAEGNLDSHVAGMLSSATLKSGILRILK